MPGWAIRVPIQSAVERPLWDALRTAPAPSSVAELHLACRACPIAINQRLNRWVRAGIVTSLDGPPKRYAMTDPAASAPVPPTVGRDNVARDRLPTKQTLLWRAMRVLAVFDLPTLQMIAETSHRSATQYVNFLCRSGHLRRERRSNSRSGSWSTYRLVRNTGPRAPMIQDTRNPLRRFVIDQNSGQRIDISPGVVDLHAANRSATAADGGEG